MNILTCITTYKFKFIIVIIPFNRKYRVTWKGNKKGGKRKYVFCYQSRRGRDSI